MILITGASGALGRLVVDRLSADGRAPIVAATRTPDALAADVPVRRMDFDDPTSLTDAFTGAQVVLLISAGAAERDVVIARHSAAIDAAEQAGVRHIFYTSVTCAGDNLAYALPHRWTERRLGNGQAAWTILRNGLYAELLVPEAAQAIATGALTAPLGDGRLAAVAREDLADATAHLLVQAHADLLAGTPGRHAGQVYDLVGTTAIGGTDLANALTSATGRSIAYQPGTLPERRTALTDLGLPAWQVEYIVSNYSTIAADFMGGTDPTLSQLLGTTRPALGVITAGVDAHSSPGYRNTGDAPATRLSS